MNFIDRIGIELPVRPPPVMENAELPPPTLPKDSCTENRTEVEPLLK